MKTKYVAFTKYHYSFAKHAVILWINDKYMKYIFLILSAIAFTNCTFQSILPVETRDKIPKDADQIILSFDISRDSVFTLVTNLLLDENYRIYNSDKQIAYINTDGKYIDKDMTMRLNIKISEKSSSSELICKANGN